ncbi:MAG TPA: molybdenum cofactor synthesis domain-containing protein, partial [Actinomycetota bacterium]|nr:molybdenum cofactor synthesis domain-containing protein [Actinomycetota bacterium]
MPGPRAAVVTVSDGVAAGARHDDSGRTVADALAAAGFELGERAVVRDERPEIEAVLLGLASGHDLVVTTGGTGLAPRDVTPEATRAVLDREAPGLAEAMRAAGRSSTPMADLSRGTAGTIGRALVVNLPGGTRGAEESLAAILPVLPHALELLAGHTAHGPAAEPDGHRALVVATATRVHGSPPCRVGQKLVIGEHGPLEGTLGCAEFDTAAIEDAPTVLAAGEPATRTYRHDLGSVEVFLEPRTAPPTLVVLGATPVARWLLRWGRDLGYTTVLVEPRADRVTAEDRARAHRVADGVDGLELTGEVDAVHTDHDAPGVAE